MDGITRASQWAANRNRAKRAVARCRARMADTQRIAELEQQVTRLQNAVRGYIRDWDDQEYGCPAPEDYGTRPGDLDPPTT